MDENKLLLVEKRFYTNGHNFNRDATFTTIERIGKNINLKSIIVKKTNG